MAQPKCPTCGAAVDVEGRCATCDTMIRLELPAPPQDAQDVAADEILLRYGKGGRHLSHLKRCFFPQARICTCGLLADLLELPGGKARELHPGIFVELHAQLEVIARLSGAGP